MKPTISYITPPRGGYWFGVLLVMTKAGTWSLLKARHHASPDDEQAAVRWLHSCLMAKAWLSGCDITKLPHIDSKLELKNYRKVKS